MRHESILLALAFVSAVLGAQQPSSQSAPATPLPDFYPPDAAPFSYRTAFYARSGVTAPTLLPLNVVGLASGHCKKLDGTTEISLIVAEDGTPAEIYLLRATGTDLDRLALNIAKDDRFDPGTYNGKPAPTVISDQIALHTCIRETPNDQGKNIPEIILRSTPDQKIELRQEPAPSTMPIVDDRTEKQPTEGPPYKVGGPVSSPVVIHSVAAQFTDVARSNKYQGVCLISLVVDAQGLPTNMRIARPLGMGLDQQAIEAIRHYRFTPAMKNGVPVPVQVTIEVDFRLY